MQLFSKEAMWDRKPLKDRYRIVIIGGGVHGLSIAYYLGNHGIHMPPNPDKSKMFFININPTILNKPIQELEKIFLSAVEESLNPPASRL